MSQHGGLSTGDHDNQVDPVAVLERPVQFIGAGRLPVHIDLDKGLQMSFLVVNQLAQPRIAGDKRFDTHADGGALNLDDFVPTGHVIQDWNVLDIP